MVNFKDIDYFTTTFQEFFPKLIHYIESEEVREIAGFGVTPGQINALLVLLKENDITMGELSAKIYLAESAATRLVDRLVKMDLTGRKGDEKDRRIVRVYLTPEGKKLAEKAFQRRIQRFRTLAEYLQPEEREMLIISLQAVQHYLESNDPGGQV